MSTTTGHETPTGASANDGRANVAPDGQRGRRAWWLVASLLVAAFLARAPLYLSVFPPFEGWDEYQHLAYIAHLDETGSIPILNRSTVPLSLYPVLVAVPHPEGVSQQIHEWGLLSYADYWTSPSPGARADQRPTSSTRLYQAQHPPLAYAVAVPVWRASRATHPLEAIYAIRVMNLLLVAAALALFAAALTRLVPAFGPRVAVLALVCTHPLFFQNVARVANDALAVAAGVAGISLLALTAPPTFLRSGLLAAGCVAASIWSKQTGLTLIPALMLGLPLIGWAQGMSVGRLWRVTGVVMSALLVLVAPWWLWSFQEYGSIVTTQESLELAAKGSVVDAMVTSFQTLNWRSLTATLFIPGTPWVGGWSFLPMDATLAVIHGWYWGALAAAAGIGAVVASYRAVSATPVVRLPGLHGRSLAGLVVCAAVVVTTALGMIHHALLSHALFGGPTTNPWYFMTALPFLFVLVVRGIEVIDRRAATAAAGVLCVLFVAIDLDGTWVQMPTHYANTTDVAIQWSRLTAIHPAMLSGELRWLFLAIQVGALGLVVAGVVYVVNRR